MISVHGSDGYLTRLVEQPVSQTPKKTTLKNATVALQDIRVPFDLMAQDPRTEDPRNQDLKDFAKANQPKLGAWMWMKMPQLTWRISHVSPKVS